ncbi:MAG: hypothetical protein WAN50_01275 [Minisyncoccia bacterium]
MNETERLSTLINTARNNPKVRRRLGHEDPLYFALLYLTHHFKHPLAPMHLEMFDIVKRGEINLAAVMAFRESGKSTILNTVCALWSILCKPERKFVVIVSKTQEQAKNHFTNIKAELERNPWLKEDFGPFTERPEEWSKQSLELEYHGAKILSVTARQSLRGMKHLSHRPDLIIIDDVEDATSVRDDRSRGDDLYQWYLEEVVPAGTDKTRIIVLGNLLSMVFDEKKPDFLVMRLRREILSRRQVGLFRAYPLIDNNGECLWPGKYPTRESLKVLREKVGRGLWQREYLLKVWGQEDTALVAPLFYGSEHGRWSMGAHFITMFNKDGYTVYDGENGVMLQQPLIAQMAKYEITAPSIRTMLFYPTKDDPRLKKYLEGLLLECDYRHNSE